MAFSQQEAVAVALRATGSIAGVIMLVNLIVDLLYGLINPRIRHAR